MKIFKTRLIHISVMLLLCFCVLIGRLFYIQILNGNKYATRCRRQSKLRTLISARRGTIRDCVGNILAKSITSHLRLETNSIAKDADTQKIIDKKISRKEVFVKTFNDLMKGKRTTGVTVGDIK